MTRREAVAALTAASAAAYPSTPISLTSLDGIDVLNAKAQATTYRGQRCIRLLDSPNADPNMTEGRKLGEKRLVGILTRSDFQDGVLEVEVAGSPRAGSPDTTARGFIGIAFRTQKDAARYECFYLRPTNGRANDQLRRNHSVQYVSEPEFPWERLRSETPGVYESYCDLEPGAWTRMKIKVSGIAAKLFVNGAARPCLIVNDLKMGRTKGQLALWIGPETDGYFSNLKVTTSA
jgi:hypothetical protein